MLKHVVLLLYAGDYYDASVRRAEGLADRYRHHSYALDSLRRVRDDGVLVTVVQMHSEEPYDRLGDDRIRYLGLGRGTSAEVGAYLRDEGATHVMLRFPSVEVLREIVASRARASVVLADSFPSPVRNRRRYRELRSYLQHPSVDFVANHHLNSSRQLVEVLGVDARRVIPWDWPLDLTGLARSGRSAPARGKRVRLCYAGSLHKIKGVWDLLEAVSILRDGGQEVVLDIAGAGDAEELWRRIDRLGLRDLVTVLGRVGGDEILEMMRSADFVCVPSRHSYPEGLPLTIYEAMASGTPLVTSDHPMFAGVVRDGETGFVFRAGRPGQMASAVLRAWGDTQVYDHVSTTAAQAYERLGLDTLWGELVQRWVRGDPQDREWLDGRTLAARRGADTGTSGPP